MYIDKAFYKNSSNIAEDSDRVCSFSGDLGWHGTKRNYSSFVTLPKVTKESVETVALLGNVAAVLLKTLSIFYDND